jgi:hypothetical protein
LTTDVLLLLLLLVALSIRIADDVLRIASAARRSVSWYLAGTILAANPMVVIMSRLQFPGSSRDSGDSVMVSTHNMTLLTCSKGSLVPTKSITVVVKVIVVVVVVDTLLDTPPSSSFSTVSFTWYETW